MTPATPPPSVHLRQVLLDAADHRQLAEFYRRFLQATYVPGSEPREGQDPQYIEMTVPGVGIRLAFQADHNYRAPDWPEHQVSSTQAHLDFDVAPADLDTAISWATSLGARLVSEREHAEGVAVLTDPAGHPFCLIAVP